MQYNYHLFSWNKAIQKHPENNFSLSLHQGKKVYTRRLKSTLRFNSIYLNYHSSSFTNFCCGKKSETWYLSENTLSKCNNVTVCIYALMFQNILTMLTCSDNGPRSIKVLAIYKLSIWLSAHHARRDPTSKVQSFYISDLNAVIKRPCSELHSGECSLTFSHAVIMLLSLTPKRLHQECYAQLWAPQIGRMGRKLEKLLR